MKQLTATRDQRSQHIWQIECNVTTIQREQHRFRYYYHYCYYYLGYSYYKRSKFTTLDATIL